jgi:hypothetical protein
LVVVLLTTLSSSVGSVTVPLLLVLVDPLMARRVSTTRRFAMRVRRPSPQVAPRPLALYGLIALLALLGVAAVYGGGALVADPTGAGLQLPLSYLDGSPFRDYSIPGIILLLVLGITPLVAAVALWLRPRWAAAAGLEHLLHQHWAWMLAVAVGLALVVWIAVQLTMVPYFFLQPVMLLVGLLIVVLAFSTPVRRYYLR